MSVNYTNAGTPKRVAVAQIGARRHYAIPEALETAGRLDSLITDLYAASPWLTYGARLLGAPRLLDRASPGLPLSKVRHFPWFGLRRVWRSRHARSGTERLEGYLDANLSFCKLVCSHWPPAADAVYVFNSAGLEILQEAKPRGCRCIVDQITAPWAVEEQLIEEERRQWPDWEPAGTDRAAWNPLAEREQKEWTLADVIVCGSAFVKDSIAQLRGPADKCVVVPYGVTDRSLRASPRVRHTGPLRVLFAGTLQLRKGLQYLQEAAQLVPAGTAIFRAVGASQIARSVCDQLRTRMELREETPRSAMVAEYDWADVLAAPSISEGSANVCYEALAAGLPVITTPNAGSVVRDGIEGYVVPVRNAQAIADRIATLASDNELWARLSASAIARAKEYSWPHYAKRLMEAISKGQGT